MRPGTETAGGGADDEIFPAGAHRWVKLRA